MVFVLKAALSVPCVLCGERYFMKILILGSNGQLGWELCRQAPKHGFDIIPFDLPEFDITNPDQVKKAVLESNASLVINAAAYTAVDKAESEPELAFAVNRDGPAYLASSCAKANIPLIHISTDYVFDGCKKSPYLESDPVCPLGVYGKSKAEGEDKVRAGLVEHLIFRTSWLYGIHGNNFVKTMLKLGKENEILRVVCDQYGCPTYAGDLSDAILKISDSILDGKDVVWGVYHFSNEGETTWHGFAEKIFLFAREYASIKVKKVDPVMTSFFKTHAKRPLNSSLNCSSISKNFDINRKPWRDSLRYMLNLYYQQHDQV